MNLDIVKLEALAKAATQGEWGYDGSYVCTARIETGTKYVETWNAVADCNLPDNTKFIAAANPAAVLELIAELKQLRKDSERLDRLDLECEGYGCEVHEGNRWVLDGQFHSARDAIDALIELKS